VRSIAEILSERPCLSFEVFPPKPTDDEDMRGIFSTLSALASAEPDFVSVTYSPAGRNSDRALSIASFAADRGMTPLSHFTAVGYGREEAAAMLAALRERGLRNVLALRGDLPPGGEVRWKDFRHASDMIECIRGLDPGICVGAACYPEGHAECADPALDIERTRRKEELGASFFISQLFFDNDIFFSFVERARAAGLRSPIVAGVMPVLRAANARRIIELTGCSIPPALAALFERHGGDPVAMEDAGMDYAAAQIDGLRAAGVDGIHVYTMNRAAQALEILRRAGIAAR
jgi:methylenetetrahydrofolate reductase (NADPH)